ncbi:carboxymuconolactone decarboxylase family protein [Microbacterium sp. KHB019]|uniref:carboxymuconolactone decarboxylase family protein n=1 Tax=Microbacterium sp. KHB019 TaxID=3129770 RepID=UPI003079697A
MVEFLLEVADDQSEDLTVEKVGAAVRALLVDAPPGEPLDDVTAALVGLATRACGTTLDLEGTREHIGRVLDAGGSGEQIEEMMVLISGIGIHGLIGTASVVARALREHGHPAVGDTLTPEQEVVWERLGGGDAREARVARVSPDFLPNLVRLVPEPMVKAVLDFRAAPWFSETLTPLQMEFIGIAVDTMPSHRFMPTLRMHVGRALDLGAGRRQIEDVLSISAAAPQHRGLW